MNKLFLRLILVVLLLNFFKINAQSPQQIIPNVILPSANATSSIYGNVAANEYTGSAEISIPICELKSGPITIPIVLNYNSKGVRVAQESSWVGLGWNLLAGGSVVRKVNGLDDFELFKGYVFCEEIPEPLDNMFPDYNEDYIDRTYETYDLIQNYYNGLQDADPDNFYINFLGKNNELFFQKQDGTILTATAINQDNFIYKYNTDTKTWEVTDDKGWTYYFSTKEYTKFLTSSSSTFLDYPTGYESQEIITAWYLDKIMTPENETVTFYYSNLGEFTESQPAYDEVSSHGPFPPGSFYVNDNFGLIISSLLDNNSNKYHVTVNKVKDVYLNKIDLNEQGTVEFETKDRYDIKYNNVNNPPQALQNIKMKDKQGKLIKIFSFTTNYFRQEMINHPDRELYLRLRLDAFKEGGVNELGEIEYLPNYYFEYYDHPLPCKTSASTDSWGYFNGASNVVQNYQAIKDIDFETTQIVYEDQLGTVNTLKPRYYYLADQADVFNRKVFINGMNKNPNFAYATAGILLKIVYPTSGSTSFIYESNDYSGPIDEHRLSLYEDVQSVQTANTLGDEIQYFSVPANGAFALMEFNLHCYIPNTISIMENMDASLYRKQDNNWTKILTFEYSDIYTQPTQFVSHACLALKQGQYKIEVDNGGCVELDLEIHLKLLTQEPVNNRFGDGLRIKEIIKTDKYDNKLSSTQYKYVDESLKSSGKIMNKILSFYNETDLILVGLQYNHLSNDCCFLGSITEPSNANFIITWGQNLRPISNSANGNHIGYSKVTTLNYDKDAILLAKIDKYFKNISDEESEAFLPGLQTERHLDNGKLLKEIFYEGENIKVKEIEYKYLCNTSTDVNIYGVKTMFPTNPVGQITQVGAIARYYKLSSQWWYLKWKTQKTYTSDSDADYITEETTYSYGNSLHKYITSQSNKISNSSTKEVIYRYPPDITGPDNLYEPMTLKNIICYPIEIITILNGNVTTAELHTFRIDQGHYRPDKDYKLNIISPIPFSSFPLFNTYAVNSLYLKEIEYATYNESGLLQTLKDQSGIYVNNIYDKKANLVCTTTNAYNEESYYTSFEDHINWIGFPSHIDDTDSHTGIKCLITNISHEALIKSITITPRIKFHSGYSASVWLKGSKNACLIGRINGQTITSACNDHGGSGEWNLLKIEIPSSYFKEGDIFQVLINSGDEMDTKTDDYRIYPSDAQMETYTYKDLIGISSYSDINNIPTFYKYDAFGRIKFIKDHNNNILHKYEYYYIH